MWSFFNLLIIACLVSLIPSTAVYLVFPSFIALIAASFTTCGVSKSGSPALKLRISLPAAYNSFAKAVIDKVSEGANFSILFAIFIIVFLN